MPPKTLTDRVNDLAQSVTALSSELKSCDKAVDDAKGRLSAVEAGLGELRTQIAILQEQSRRSDQRFNMFWTIVPPVVAVILTGLVTYFVRHLP